MRWNTFPNPQIALAEATIRDLAANWRNDFGLEPTRHLVPARRTRQSDDDTFRAYRPEAAEPGFTMVAGLSDEPGQAPHAVRLYDGAGREIYRWPVNYAVLDPEGPKPLNVSLKVEPSDWRSAWKMPIVYTLPLTRPYVAAVFELIVTLPSSGTCQPPRSTASFPFTKTHTSSSPVKSRRMVAVAS